MDAREKIPVTENRDLLIRLLEQNEGMGVLLVSPDAVVRWANPIAHVLFAAERGLADIAYDELFTPEDRALGAMQTELAIARSRGHSEDDRWHRRLDGGRFWANGMLSTLCADDGTLLAYGKIVRNRTDLKEQVVTLQSELVTLRERDRKRRTSTAEAAHEIRNTLSGMSAVVGALRQRVVDATTMARLAEITDRQLALAHRLTEELMTASAGAHVGHELRLERVALQPLLKDAVDLVANALHGRRLDLLMPPGEVECEIDAERMQQVLINLLHNAIKFTSETGSIWLRLTVEGSAAVIRVEDDGVGIEQAMLKRIFDVFTQVEPKAGAQSGVGLGLALARETITRFGGNIQAISNGLGRGAVFSIRLPMAGRSVVDT
jgi:signal transduction histidine kinase